MESGVNPVAMVESLLAAYVTGRQGEVSTKPTVTTATEPVTTQPEKGGDLRTETPVEPPPEDPAQPKPRQKPIDDPALYERFKKLELD